MGPVFRRGRRQSLLILAIAAAGLLGAVPAFGTSPIDQKKAEAEQVYAQVIQLNQELGVADEKINLANLRLAQVEDAQKLNQSELVVAQQNLARSTKAIAKRLVALYTAPQSSTLEMILGATSLGDLMTRIDNADRISSVDGTVIKQVVTFKTAVVQHSHELANENAYAKKLLAQRQAERDSVNNEIAQRDSLLSSIKGEIAKLQAEEAARQLQAARDAQAAIAAAQAQQLAAVQSTSVGVSVATPDGGSVVPPSTLGGRVVAIAMSYIGVPYVWGGSTPGGFDCSGLVMYSFGQLGISLPHSTYAQWNYGESVPYDQLQPGDMVFFDGLGHVGLYIGGGEYVDAPYTGVDVRVDSLDNSWAQSHYVGARRIV